MVKFWAEMRRVVRGGCGGDLCGCSPGRREPTG